MNIHGEYDAFWNEVKVTY